MRMHEVTDVRQAHGAAFAPKFRRAAPAGADKKINKNGAIVENHAVIQQPYLSLFPHRP